MRSSIRVRLTIAFIGLAIGPLLLLGVILAWQSFTVQEQQALNSQRELARRVSTQVTAFFGELEDQLLVINQVQGLRGLDSDKQRSILSELLSYQRVFEELVLLDDQGQEQIHLSRTNPLIPLGNRTGTDEFDLPRTKGEIYYSPVRFDEATGEPLMTIAVPLFDPRSGQVDEVLVSETRIKTIWDLIANVQVGPGQSVYIVDAQDKVVAHRNPSVVLRGTTFNIPDHDGLQPGLTGSNTILAAEAIRFGPQEFNIVVEQEWAEALALAINSVYISGAVTVTTLVVAGILGLLIVRQIVRPIQAMAAAAQAVSAGDLAQQVKVAGQDELSILAKAFNQMTSQLGDLIGSLEDQVRERVTELTLSVQVGQRAAAIRELDQLLPAITEFIRAQFSLYYTQVYFVDDLGQNLALKAGTGTVGQELIARRHSLPLGLGSIIGRVAAEGKSIVVPDTQNSDIHKANPLLPETRSELAIPLIVEGRVIGVLDMQADKVNTFTENNVTAFEAMATQLAISINSAQQWARAQEAQQKMEEAIRQLTRQSWVERLASRRENLSFAYDLSAIAPLALAELEAVNGDTKQAVPVVVQNEAIGQLAVNVPTKRALSPDEQDLLAAVAQQLGQKLENLRLFEQTQQRAAREQIAREITDKVRASRDIEAALKVAAEELSKALSTARAVVDLRVAPRSVGQQDQN
ncbi:MAG: GAF domain-containing protein [Anaerolineales bacterium]|nr:GAF domain-containing protein [Anaerolineales bacterium]